MKKQTNKEEEFVSCCNECGKKRYKIIRDAGAITICMGECPICKKEKGIVPASDWQFMCGSDGAWD